MKPSSRIRIRPGRPICGTIVVPGDKSISHRALILGSLARGTNYVHNWLAAGDTLATLEAIRALGINIQRQGNSLIFEGGRLSTPSGPINCANAGTAIRLLAGLLAGQPFPSVLDGSKQLRRRPMRRVVQPLRHMGAAIVDTNGYAPLSIRPAELLGISYHLPVASAQVKSALLLAGLHTDQPTKITEPGPSRDHTERILAAMGADIHVTGRQITVVGTSHALSLAPLNIAIPGDLSSAAFLVGAAALLPGSDVHIMDVGLNPTRTGILDVMRHMGAVIAVEDMEEQSGEPIGMLCVCGSQLRAIHIAGDLVVRSMDELPILAVVATQAEGETVISDAAELRVKETDRIGLLTNELRKLGAEIEEMADGMIISGPVRLHGAEVSSHGDHRLGMALTVAGLVAEGETVVHGAGCIDDSFPAFAETLASLGAEIVT